MRFGKWNAESLPRSRSLMTAARELARHKLDLVFVQGFGWTKGAQ